MKNRFVFGSFAGVFLLLSAQVVPAQQGPAAQTPAQVLSQYPDGGVAMETQVQTLMNADRASLAAIIAFARTATEDQRKAIARGLANVAKAYAASDPGFATQIQRSVAAAGLPEFAKAYAEAAGDTGTAAAGGGRRRRWRWSDRGRSSAGRTKQRYDRLMEATLQPRGRPDCSARWVGRCR